ncbi:MAG: hypothetical protein EOO78_25890, partial [Oxalobacteraceae bacterium]
KIPGAVIGSFVFVAVSEALRIAPELRMIMYGCVLLGLVFLFPKGLAPMFQSAAEWLARIGQGGARHGKGGSDVVR